MRFAILLTALATFWVQPAQAVTYAGTLTSEDPEVLLTAPSNFIVRTTVTFDRPVTGWIDHLWDINYSDYTNPGGDYIGGNNILGGGSEAFTSATSATVHYNFPYRQYRPGEVTMYEMGPGQITLLLTDLSAPVNYTLTSVGIDGIPEPATWALMLLGVGFAGAAMRRTRMKPSLRAT